jgi:hypothetical protein
MEKFDIKLDVTTIKKKKNPYFKNMKKPTGLNLNFDKFQL